MPIIIHNESERAKTWTKVFSEKTKKQSIPVITAWQLNERMYGVLWSFSLLVLFTFNVGLIWWNNPSFFYRYGELQGLNKQETAERYGNEKVHEWRRSYDIPPPSGESLEMCSERAVAYFKDCVRTSVSFFPNLKFSIFDGFVTLNMSLECIVDRTPTESWEACVGCCAWEFIEIYYNVSWQINISGGIKLQFFFHVSFYLG